MMRNEGPIADDSGGRFAGVWANCKNRPHHLIFMKTTARLDERGRLTILRAYPKILRDRIVQILTPHGVLLRPVPDTLPDRGRLPPALTEIGEEEAEGEAGRYRTPRTSTRSGP